MNQHETTWLRKIIFVTVAILVFASSVASVRPVFAQTTAASFDAVNDHISTRMKELGIPGALQSLCFCQSGCSFSEAEFSRH